MVHITQLHGVKSIKLKLFPRQLYLPHDPLQPPQWPRLENSGQWSYLPASDPEWGRLGMHRPGPGLKQGELQAPRKVCLVWVMVSSEIKRSPCLYSGACPELTCRPRLASVYQDVRQAWRAWPHGYRYISIWVILSLYYWTNLWLESLTLVIGDPRCGQMKQFARSKAKGGLRSWGSKHNSWIPHGWPAPRVILSPVIERSVNYSLNASSMNSPKHSKWDFSHFD